MTFKHVIKLWLYDLKDRSDQGRIQEIGEGGAHGEHGSASLYGVWGLCPQWGPGAKPLVRGSGGEAPLKLKAF